MPLLTRIPAHHSIREFRTAAGQRYNEAVQLSSAGDRLAAIYLAGYVAEMLLKAAYFRLARWSPTQAIGLADLHNARNLAVARGVEWPRKDLHDLRGWRGLVIAERRHQGRPYAREFERAIVAQVDVLNLNWAPVLRYHSNRPRVSEVSASLGAANWLRTRFWLL